MTPAEVRANVNQIIRVSKLSAESDDRGHWIGHQLEDQLRRDLIKAIAEGRAIDPVACCREAMRTEGAQLVRIL